MELTSGFTAICHHPGNPSLAREEHSVPADSLKEGEKIDSRAAAIRTNRHIFYSNSIFHFQMPFEENLSVWKNMKEGCGYRWVFWAGWGVVLVVMVCCQCCFVGTLLFLMMSIFFHVSGSRLTTTTRCYPTESCCCCLWPWLTCWQWCLPGHGATGFSHSSAWTCCHSQSLLGHSRIVFLEITVPINLKKNM